jgi:hypothetical protein
MISIIIENTYIKSIYKPQCHILITPITYFTLDEILSSYLDDTYLCGICYDLLFADGVERTPIEFLEHDINHADVYIGNCAEKFSKFVVFKDFYSYCQRNCSPEQLQSVKFILFLLLHESVCTFKFTENWEKENRDKLLIDNLLENNNYVRMDDFIDDNGLWTLIPKKYRIPAGEHITAREKIVPLYFKISCGLFFNALDNFKIRQAEAAAVVGGKSNNYTKQRRRTKRRRNSRKQRKSRKCRK